MTPHDQVVPDLPQISRRVFLRRVGASLAGVAAAGLPFASTQAAPAASLHIAVIVPESSRVVGIGAQLLRGMAAASPELAITPFTYQRPTQALGAAHDAAASGQFDAVVGMLSHHHAADLGPALQASGVPLIVADMGANMPRPGQDAPYVLRSSLGMWQAAWALGSHTARTQGREAILASSLYESGYDLLFAFRQGFEQAGGTIVASHVTHVGEQDGLGTLYERVRAERPALVAAFYSGSEAEAFVAGYREAGLAAPLVGLAPLAEAAALPTGTLTAATWSPDLASGGAAQFHRAYQVAHGHAPDAYAALGYDTAKLLAHARRQGGALRDSLASTWLTGARGPLALAHQGAAGTLPIFLRTSDGVRTTTIGQLAAPAEAAVAQALAGIGAKTGWLGAYLSL